MNFFQDHRAAVRYAKGRPPFHANTIKHIKTFLQLEQKLGKALDMGCGTGLSTRALLPIADQVFGADSSPEMLQQATRSDAIQYVLATAEALPFSAQYFDLLTVGSGVHWFRIDAFLKEAYRVLKSHAWLVLYENHFIAEMEGQDDFGNWFREEYLKKFPSPARNNDYPWSQENLANGNFHFIKEERFKNPITFNQQQLALYFTTQSNIIAAVKQQTTSYEAADQWLQKELHPFFKNNHRAQTIYFGNWIKYIQRSK